MCCVCVSVCVCCVCCVYEHVFCVNRLDVKGGELGKETLRRDTGSLGAGSDCASTRGMAGFFLTPGADS